MHRRPIFITSFVLALALTVHGQRPATYFANARVIVGDGSVIDRASFIVADGRITDVGPNVKAPAGATRVDLAGKTVMPAMINVHVHIGYEGYTSWGAENYTPQNVLDHLQREAFYGTAATQSVGTSPIDASLQFQRDQQAGKFPPASRFLFMPGMAPPNGGPGRGPAWRRQALHVVNEVSTAQEARAAVQAMADKKIRSTSRSGWTIAAARTRS